MHKLILFCSEVNYTESVLLYASILNAFLPVESKKRYYLLTSDRDDGKM